MAMPQHRDLWHPLYAHPCVPRTRRGNLGRLSPHPHSRAVCPPRDRHAHPVAVALQATPPTGWQRSTDLIEVVSSTHSQLTA